MVIHQRIDLVDAESEAEVSSWRLHLSAVSEVLFQKAAELGADSCACSSILVEFQMNALFTAPFNAFAGGQGLLHRANALLYADTLRALGAGDLSVARIIEGHFNACELILRYGSPAQCKELEDAIRLGALSGVWGADGAQPLRAVRHSAGWLLDGAKVLASGAGLLTRPLVTATTEEGQLLFLLEMPSDYPVDLSGWTPMGMRGSLTGSVDLSGMLVQDHCRVGQPGDFMRQPHFSGGAWRFCAAHVGAMERLIDLFRDHLIRRGRDEDGYQLERIAKAVTSCRTARYWVERCATIVADAMPAVDVVGFANMTRVVTERAALDVLEQVQRGIGLQAFIHPHPVERISRDLATYLRQPVPDLAMADGARAVLASPLPFADLWGQNAR